jgi:hypothetical protein
MATPRKEVIETKGPVGDIIPPAPAPSPPEVAAILAAQSQLAGLVGSLATQLGTIQQANIDLAQRVQVVEGQTAALLEAMLGLRSILQRIAQSRML